MCSVNRWFANALPPGDTALLLLPNHRRPKPPRVCSKVGGGENLGIVIAAHTVTLLSLPARPGAKTNEPREVAF